MDFEQLKDLLAQFDQSSVRELNLQKDDFNLYLNKNEQSQGVALAAPSTPVATPAPVAEAPVVAVAPAPGVTSEATTSVAVGATVDSPIVGVVYLSSAPDEPVFKKVGDAVAVGDTLCIVEAMKIMNEITSDVAGTITEILIKNEDVVEYGQALFRIV